VSDLAAERALIAETSEGAQEMQPRGQTDATELLMERGAVLRLPEGHTVSTDDLSIEVDEDETMIINMGPQHPSTHGVLRVMMELEGETVLRSKPVIGYLHTGMEKTAEDLMYIQGSTNVTRMDYLANFSNETVFSMAVEALLGIEVPPRAVWIRMLLMELNRMSSHLLFMATNGMDVGAVSMMIFGWRERELCLAFFEKVTGLRMNYNFIRPGGTAADLPAGWRDDVLEICNLIEPRMDEYDELITGQPIFQQRTQGVGVITPEQAIALGASGPILRATGTAWDLRADLPYAFYEQLGHVGHAVGGEVAVLLLHQVQQRDQRRPRLGVHRDGVPGAGLVLLGQPAQRSTSPITGSIDEMTATASATRPPFSITGSVWRLANDGPRMCIRYGLAEPSETR
jgi:NADH-quinone oxidoreductase subunit D